MMSMIIKLRFTTGVTPRSPEATAFVEAKAVYYDEQYEEVIVRLAGSGTDLAANAPASVWSTLEAEVELAVREHCVVDATSGFMFRSVSREYTLLHWKAAPPPHEHVVSES